MEGREFPHVLARGLHRNDILDPDFPGSSVDCAPLLNGMIRAVYETVFPWRGQKVSKPSDHRKDGAG
jgi:hypothetical protein